MTVFAPFLTTYEFLCADCRCDLCDDPLHQRRLNASYTERVSDHVITPQDLILVSLNYKPY